MADNTGIQWTDATWNPIAGCSIVSPACTNCYAMNQAAALERRFGSPKYAGLTKTVNSKPVWTGEVRLHEPSLDQPLRWKRGRRIFVNSMSDLFHENLPDEAIDRIFAVMALAPQHTFQVLTKRPERMRRYMAEVVKGPWGGRAHVIDEAGVQHPMTDVHFRMNSVLCNLLPKVPAHALNFASKWADDHYPDGDGFLRCWPLPNVWLGVTAEDQTRADERIPILLATPATKRFVSVEPLLAPVDLTPWLHGTPRLDWIIVGGESGRDARPMRPDWARSLRDQCFRAGVPFFFKQWGEHAPYDRGGVDSRLLATPGSTDEPIQRFGKKAAGRLLDGVEHSGIPA